MDSAIPVLLALAVLFVATFTRSALGFGDAVVAMPLLALFLSMRIATPLVAFTGSTIAITILIRKWRSVDVHVVWKLIVATLVGIPFGLYFLTSVPESYIKGILGIILAVFGLYNLIMPNLPTLRDNRLAYIFGLVAGILGGAYNVNGPPVVIYGTVRGWSKEDFRSTLQSYFLPTGLMIIIGHGIAGLWTPMVLRLYVYALPVIMAGIFLGGKAPKTFLP